MDQSDCRFTYNYDLNWCYRYRHGRGLRQECQPELLKWLKAYFGCAQVAKQPGSRH